MQQQQPRLKEQVTFGSDVGSSNWGFAGARNRGFVNQVDAEQKVVQEGLPDIEVLCLERWDLKQGRVLTHDADWNPVLVQLDGFEGKSELMTDWRRALVRCVQRCGPLNELTAQGTLPTVVTENQCDMIKTDFHKTEMLRLAEQFQMAVEMTDQQHQHPARVNCYSNAKYMMRNDNSLTRPQRKVEQQRIILELCEQLQLTGPLRFFRTLLGRGEQIHDICDALGLVIQYQINEGKAQARALVREMRALIKSIPVTPTKKRVKKQPLKPITEKRYTAINLISDDEDEETVDFNETVSLPPKKRAPAKKKPPPQAKKRTRNDATFELKGTADPVKKRQKGSIFASPDEFGTAL